MPSPDPCLGPGPDPQIRCPKLNTTNVQYLNLHTQILLSLANSEIKFVVLELEQLKLDQIGV